MNWRHWICFALVLSMPLMQSAARRLQDAARRWERASDDASVAFADSATPGAPANAVVIVMGQMAGQMQSCGGMEISVQSIRKHARARLSDAGWAIFEKQFQKGEAVGRSADNAYAMLLENEHAMEWANHQQSR